MHRLPRIIRVFSSQQQVQLVPRTLVTLVVISPMVTVGHDHTVQIGFFQGFPSKELNTVNERLLDDDVLLVSPGCSHGDHLVPIAKARFVEWQGFLQVGVSHSSLHGGDVLGQLHVCLLTSEQTLEVTTRFFHQQDGLLQVIQVNATGSVYEGVAASQLEHLEVPVGHFCLTDVFMFCHVIGQTFAFAAIGYQLNGNGIRKLNLPAEPCRVSQIEERIRPFDQGLVITRLNQVGIDLSWGLGVVSLIAGLAETKQAATSIPSLQEGVELVFSLTTIQ